MEDIFDLITIILKDNKNLRNKVWNIIKSLCIIPEDFSYVSSYQYIDILNNEWSKLKEKLDEQFILTKIENHKYLINEKRGD